jgi:hypothetical protein
MIAESIPLRFAGARRFARLRELTGRDEYQVLGLSTESAIELLNALLERLTLDAEQLHALDLVAADRDRLLAVVYEYAFGDRIESTLTCARCKQPFDLFFSLSHLIAAINDQSETGEWKAIGDGSFETADGLRFRLPTGRDELSVADLPLTEVESSLLDRCVVDGAVLENQTAFQELLERVAPLLDLELLAPCAECQHVHTVQFDIQSYLLGALFGERRRLLSEINRIAGSYAWSLEEILSLRRSDRRLLVELIENELVM